MTQKQKYFEFQNENLLRDAFVDDKVLCLLKAMLEVIWFENTARFPCI